MNFFQKCIIFFQLGLQFNKKVIRISCSSAFRIQLDSEFLLIENSYTNGLFQPVGGVYKGNYKVKQFLKSLNGSFDKCKSQTHSTKYDLRLNIPAHNVLKFLNWFLSGKHRETSPHREFVEELVEAGYLSKRNFHPSKICCNYLTTRISQIHLRQRDGKIYNQLYISEIFDINFTNKQIGELRAVRAACKQNLHPQLLWIKHENYFSKLFRPDVILSRQTGWSLSAKAWHKNIISYMPPSNVKSKLLKNSQDNLAPKKTLPQPSAKSTL